MAKRQLINSAPVSEFGEALPEHVGPEHRVDLMHVPGFSEMRHNRDIEMAEYAHGMRRGQDVSTLPVNCRWVSITRGSQDQPTSMRLMKAANDGYRPVTAEMVGKHDWITGMPPGAKQLPDGTIVNAAGDLQLHYADAPRARLNQIRKDRKAQALMDSVGQNLGDGAEGLITASGKARGIIDPTVERTPITKK